MAGFQAVLQIVGSVSQDKIIFLTDKKFKLVIIVHFFD